MNMIETTKAAWGNGRDMAGQYPQRLGSELEVLEWWGGGRGNNWEYSGRVGPCYLCILIRLTRTRPSFFLLLEAPEWIDPAPELTVLRDAMESSDLFGVARKVFRQPQGSKAKNRVLSGSEHSRSRVTLNMHSGGLVHTREVLAAVLDKFDYLVLLAEGVRDVQRPRQ